MYKTHTHILATRMILFLFTTYNRPSSPGERNDLGTHISSIFLGNKTLRI